VTTPRTADQLTIDTRLKLGVSNAPFFGYEKFVENITDEVVDKATETTYNVQHLGILPDGNDYSSQFSALFTGLAAGTCLTLYFPASNTEYRLETVSLLNVGVKLTMRGDGMFATKVKIGSATSTVNNKFYVPNGNGGLQVYDMKIFGESTTSATSTSQNREFCMWDNSSGVSDDDIIEKIVFENVWFHDLYRVLSMGSLVTQNPGLREVRVQGCAITHMRRAGVFLAHTQKPGGRWWMFKDNFVYAFGYNARNTAVELTLDDTSKMVSIPYSGRLRPVQMYNVLTGGTSSATGRICGHHSNGDGTGTLYLYQVSGTFQNAETLSTGGFSCTSTAGPTTLSAPSAGEVMTSFWSSRGDNMQFTVDGSITTTSLNATDITRSFNTTRTRGTKLGLLYMATGTDKDNGGDYNVWYDLGMLCGFERLFVGDQGGYCVVTDTDTTNPVNEKFGIGIAAATHHHMFNSAAYSVSGTEPGASEGVQIDGNIVAFGGGFDIEPPAGGDYLIKCEYDHGTVTNNFLYGHDGEEGAGGEGGDTEGINGAGAKIVAYNTSVNAGRSGCYRIGLRGQVWDPFYGYPGTLAILNNRVVNTRNRSKYAQTNSPASNVIWRGNVFEGYDPRLHTSNGYSDTKGFLDWGGFNIVEDNIFLPANFGDDQFNLTTKHVISVQWLRGMSYCSVSGNLFEGGRYNDSSTSRGILYIGCKGDESTHSYPGARFISVDRNIFNCWTHPHTNMITCMYLQLESRSYIEHLSVSGNIFCPCTIAVRFSAAGIIRTFKFTDNRFDPFTFNIFSFNSGSLDNFLSIHRHDNINDQDFMFDTTKDHGAAVANNASGTVRTLTATGARVGDSVEFGLVSGNGLGALPAVLPHVWVSAADTLSFNQHNLSGGNLNLSAERYRGQVKQIGQKMVGVYVSGPRKEGPWHRVPHDYWASEIRAGGISFTIRLEGATFKASGAAFDAVRKDLMMGFVSLRSSALLNSVTSFRTAPLVIGETLTFAPSTATALVYGVRYRGVDNAVVNLDIQTGVPTSADTWTGGTSGATGNITVHQDRTEPSGWGEIADSFAVTNVVRTGDSRVTITLDAQAGYSIDTETAFGNFGVTEAMEAVNFALAPTAIDVLDGYSAGPIPVISPRPFLISEYH
jgi:hypothetical protein